MNKSVEPNVSNLSLTKKSPSSWPLSLFWGGWFLAVVLFSLPAFLLEHALLPKPITGPLASFVYVVPRISIAADRAADSDPFFRKLRERCGTRSVAEREFRSYHTSVRRLDDEAIAFDKSGHSMSAGGQGAGIGEIARDITSNEYGHLTPQQLECMEKLGDPMVQFIQPWLDLATIETRARNGKDVTALQTQRDEKFRAKIEAWISAHPMKPIICNNTDAPSYFVCDGVPGAILIALANVKARQVCRQKGVSSSLSMVGINQHILSAMPRLDIFERVQVLTALGDERSSIGAFYIEKCLP
jgi:hypothetical protein